MNPSCGRDCPNANPPQTKNTAHTASLTRIMLHPKKELLGKKGSNPFAESFGRGTIQRVYRSLEEIIGEKEAVDAVYWHVELFAVEVLDATFRFRLVKVDRCFCLANCMVFVRSWRSSECASVARCLQMAQ